MLGLRSAGVNCLSGCLDSKGFRYSSAGREAWACGEASSRNCGVLSPGECHL